MFDPARSTRFRRWGRAGPVVLQSEAQVDERSSDVTSAADAGTREHRRARGANRLRPRTGRGVVFDIILGLAYAVVAILLVATAFGAGVSIGWLMKVARGGRASAAP